MMIIMRRVYLDNDLILGKFLEPPESEVEPFKVFYRRPSMEGHNT